MHSTVFECCKPSRSRHLWKFIHNNKIKLIKEAQEANLLFRIALFVGPYPSNIIFPMRISTFVSAISWFRIIVSISSLLSVVFSSMNRLIASTPSATHIGMCLERFPASLYATNVTTTYEKRLEEKRLFMRRGYKIRYFTNTHTHTYTHTEIHSHTHTYTHTHRQRHTRTHT